MADNNRPAVGFDSQQCRPSMLARVSQAQLRGSRHSNSVDVRDDFHPPGLAGQAMFCCCFFYLFLSIHFKPTVSTFTAPTLSNLQGW